MTLLYDTKCYKNDANVLVFSKPTLVWKRTVKHSQFLVSYKPNSKQKLYHQSLQFIS